MARGLSTTEVSEQLDVPVEQVRAHTRATIMKLGAGSKLEALIIAIRRGIIRPVGTEHAKSSHPSRAIDDTLR
jgi:DNA-binding NarL/FixJ family response regulator